MLLINGTYKQIWTSLGVFISNAGQGMVAGLISVLMTDLRTSSLDIQADLNDMSWIESSLNMAVLSGLLTSYILMEVLGRKWAYLALIIPGPIGLLLISTASSGPFILLGRILTGITSSGTLMLGAVVIGEYTSPEHRTMLLILNTAAISLGSLISRILGCYYHWRGIAMVILIPYIISFFIVCTWSESPAWLASKGNTEMGEYNFYSLGGENKSKGVFRATTQIQTGRSLIERKPYVEIFKKFTKRSFMRPLFIMFMGCVLLEVSGRNIVCCYASRIISELDGTLPISTHNLLYIDLIMTAGAILSAFLIKFMKTRTLLFSSGAASILVLLMANTYTFLTSNNLISNSHSWLSTTAFGIYFTLVNIGCIPISLALQGELFPLAHKGFGLLVTGIISYICFTTTIKAFPYLFAKLKIYGTLAITGMIQTLILMILFIVLPETKNKTLQEIEDSLQCDRVDDAKSLRDFDEKDKMLIIR